MVLIKLMHMQLILGSPSPYEANHRITTDEQLSDSSLNCTFDLYDCILNTVEESGATSESLDEDEVDDATQFYSPLKHQPGFKSI